MSAIIVLSAGLAKSGGCGIPDASLVFTLICIRDGCGLTARNIEFRLAGPNTLDFRPALDPLVTGAAPGTVRFHMCPRHGQEFSEWQFTAVAANLDVTGSGTKRDDANRLLYGTDPPVFRMVLNILIYWWRG